MEHSISHHHHFIILPPEMFRIAHYASPDRNTLLSSLIQLAFPFMIFLFLFFVLSDILQIQLICASENPSKIQNIKEEEKESIPLTTEKLTQTSSEESLEV